MNIGPPDREVSPRVETEFTGTQLFLNRLVRDARRWSRGTEMHYDTNLQRNLVRDIQQAGAEPLLLDILALFSPDESRYEVTNNHFTIPRQVGLTLPLALMNLHMLFKDGKPDGQISTSNGLPSYTPSKYVEDARNLTKDFFEWIQKQERVQVNKIFSIEIEGSEDEDVRTLVITNNELGIRAEILYNTTTTDPGYKYNLGFLRMLGAKIFFDPRIKISSDMVAKAYSVPLSEMESKQKQQEKNQYQRSKTTTEETAQESGETSFIGMLDADIKRAVESAFAALESTIIANFDGHNTALDLQIFGATSSAQHNTKTLSVAYRRLAALYHPDLHPEKNENLMKRINLAYDRVVVRVASV